MSETPIKPDTVSIYCDKALSLRFKDIVKTKSKKSLAAEWNDIMLRRIQELEGVPISAVNRDQEYEKLTLEHLKLNARAQQIEMFIRRNPSKNLWNTLNLVCRRLKSGKDTGLDVVELSNLESCIPMIYESARQWHLNERDVQVFITFLEADRKRIAVEKQLRELRLERSRPKVQSNVVPTEDNIPKPSLAIVPVQNVA